MEAHEQNVVLLQNWLWTYLTFVLGAVNTLTVVYYLLIKNAPALEAVFPKFLEFSVIATAIGVPLSVFTGWLHLKGTPAMTSEVDIGVEANPYYYKLPPGYYREAWFPTYLELLRFVRMIAERQGLMTEDDQNRIRELEAKLTRLIEGGYVGTPRRRTPI
jgi:hypothetical protein